MNAVNFSHTRLATSRAATRQRGQGAVEFLLAAAPILLLGLGSIETVHWYFTRQAISLALVQAARVAITRHADPAVLDQAFADALLPLYAGPTPGHGRARLQRSMERRTRATGLPAWQIRILSPALSDFQDFASGDPALLHHGGRRVIDNDYLHEQHQARLASGLAEGRGPISGRTTIEANTLVLHLTWLHEPLLPGIKALLRQLAPADARYGSLAMARSGFLPIQRSVALVMQSHAIAWELPAHGRVQRAAHAAGTEDEHLGSSERENAGPPPPCTGLWCVDTTTTAPSPLPLPDARSIPGANFAEGDTHAPTADAPATPPAAGEPAYLEPGSGAAEPLPSVADPDDCPGCCA